jgi:TetR/AcrR family transcriptional regulator, tetracycline repressor protein
MTSQAAVRERLGRRRVLQAAIELIDREGLDALTMRRLATDLDVDPMTVHHHVGSKDRLLDGVAELLWEEVDRPGEGQGVKDVLRSLAHGVRKLFHRHPEAAPLVIRCNDLTRSELELWRSYLDALTDAGLDEPAAVMRPVLFYALGTGNAEVAMMGQACDFDPGRSYSEREVLLGLGQALPPDTPPELAAAAVAVIADCEADRCFSDGLELMLAGISASPKR